MAPLLYSASSTTGQDPRYYSIKIPSAATLEQNATNFPPNTPVIRRWNHRVDNCAAQGNNGDNNSEAPIGKIITLKNNKAYVSSENGSKAMTCFRTTAGDWEKFKVVDAGEGKIALKGNNNKYVSAENGINRMTCNKSTIGHTEKFNWEELNTNTVVLRGSNGKNVSSAGNKNPMICNLTTIGPWSKFIWTVPNNSNRAGNNSSLSMKASIGIIKSTTVFPNPSKGGTVFLQLDDIDGNLITYYSLLDVSGNIVLPRKKAVNPKTIIDTSSLNIGVYFVKVENSQGSKMLKLILQ